MKADFKIACGIGLVAIMTGFLFANIPQNKTVGVKGDEFSKTVTLEGESFRALVADTDYLRQKGLGGREELEKNEAMLFIFDEPGLYGFWMKDMKFSIDIVWADENMKIVGIKESVSPDTYPETFFPEKPAKYVVEFSRGTVSRLGVSLGETFIIK